MTWTAIDLLDKILEFVSMTPDEKDWNIKSLTSNKPRQVRLQRIIALLSAYGMVKRSKNGRILKDDVKNAIQSFLYWDFVEKRDLSVYKSVITSLEKYLSTPYRDVKIGLNDLRHFYGHLVDYKNAVRRVLNYNSGSEGSNGVIAAYQLSEECNRKIREQMKPIDHLLAQIIDPENREFEEQVLIDKYGFPEDDLLDIDIDWM